MTKLFLDSSLIIYANDARDPKKGAIARERIAQAMIDGSGVVSAQVLQEYAVVALRKLHQDPDVVLATVLLLESLEVILVTPALIRRGLEIQARYQIDYWDASILAAAESAKCSLLLSEDLNPGQLYSGVRVENPFPKDLLGARRAPYSYNLQAARAFSRASRKRTLFPARRRCPPWQ